MSLCKSTYYTSAMRILECGRAFTHEEFNEAIDLFLKGASLGDMYCYGRLKEVLADHSYWLIVYEENADRILRLFQIREEVKSAERNMCACGGVFGVLQRVPVNRSAADIIRGGKTSARGMSQKDECLEMAENLVAYCKKYDLQDRIKHYKKLLPPKSPSKKVIKVNTSPKYQMQRFSRQISEWRTFPSSIHMRRLIIGGWEIAVTSPRHVIIAICSKFVDDGMLTLNQINGWGITWLSDSRFIKNPVEIAGKNLYYSGSKNWRDHFRRAESLLTYLEIDAATCRVEFDLAKGS